MAHVAPALRLCKHQITILASLSSLTLSSSINIFFAFRILQTRMMVLYSLHCPNPNNKLGALLRGATCIRHLYGTTITAHQQFSRSFFEPCAVYLRFVTFLVFSHCSTLDPRRIIPWKENIPDFENSNKYMKDNSSFQNWPFVIGLIATISSFGAQCPFMFEENDIGLWNTRLSSSGNQN